MSFLLTSLMIGIGSVSADARINLADFGRVVRFEGDCPGTLREIEIEHASDGWSPWIDDEGVAWIGLAWDEPRLVTEVEIEFRHAIADRRLVRVEYFEHESISDPSCGGQAGYDAYHGRWKKGRTDWWAGDRFVGFEFLNSTDTQPSSDTAPEAPDTGYPRTNRLRFFLGQRDYELPPVRFVRVYGPHAPREVQLDILSDRHSAFTWPIEVSVTNGLLLNLPENLTTRTAALDPEHHTLHVRYHEAARGANRTVVTLQSAGSEGVGLSFLPDEVVREGLIRIPSLGVTVADRARNHDGPPIRRPRPSTPGEPADPAFDTVREHDPTDAERHAIVRPPLPDEGVGAIRISHPEVQAFVEQTLAELTALALEPHDPGQNGAGPSADTWAAIVGALNRIGPAHGASKWLEAVLSDQSRCRLPGRFKDQDGALCIGCQADRGEPDLCASTLDHGVILAAVGDYYRMTRDRFWLSEWADTLAAACDFIIRHAKTHRAPDGPSTSRRTVALLPAGGVEGSPLWYSWLAVDAQTAFGLRLIADAFIDINHPEAARIGRAADAYFRHVAQCCRQALGEEPLVRLSDGTYEPRQPRRAGSRRNCTGCAPIATDPVRLIDTGIYDALSREAGWILAAEARKVEPYRVGPMALPRLIAHLRRGQKSEALRIFDNSLANIPNDGEADPLSADEDTLRRFGLLAEQARCLLMLRHMLVHEWHDGLMLLSGVPEKWLEPGGRIAVQGLPTAFGPIGVRAEVAPDGLRMDIFLKASWHQSPDGIRIHANRPGHIRRVTRNGMPISTFDPTEKIISLDGPINGTHLEIIYSNR